MRKDAVLKQETLTVAVWQLYLAAAFGAFCLGFGDLVKNDDAATVMKIHQILRERFLFPWSSPVPALVFLTGLGVGYCWIQGPSTLVDAFNRGFSVFAVLAVAAATDAVPVEGISALAAMGLGIRGTQSLIAPAYAQEDRGSEIGLSAKLGEAIIQITTLKDNVEMPVTTVTIRDAATKRVIGREKIPGATFRIQRPPGKYLVEVETPGYRLTEVMLKIEDQINAYTLSLPETALPLSVQRLYGATSGRLEALPDAEQKERIKKELERSKERLRERFEQNNMPATF